MKYNLLKPFKRESAIVYFKKLLDKSALIELREIKGKRSIDQNSLYWMYLTCLEVETGQDRNDLHFHFACKFLGYEKVNIFGKEQIKPTSTTIQDTKQFTEYLNKIANFALMELNIVMPDPDSNRLLEFYNEYKEYL
jgi:hypothetical protein